MLKAILRAISQITGRDEDIKSDAGALLVKIAGSSESGGAVPVRSVYGLPLGSLSGQTPIAASASAVDQTLTQPARGAKFSLGDGSAADPDLYAIITWDMPDTLTRDYVLNESNGGVPRHELRVSDEPLEITFTNPDGTETTISTLHVKFSAATAGAKLHWGIVP